MAALTDDEYHARIHAIVRYYLFVSKDPRSLPRKRHRRGSPLASVTRLLREIWALSAERDRIDKMFGTLLHIDECSHCKSRTEIIFREHLHKLMVELDSDLGTYSSEIRNREQLLAAWYHGHDMIIYKTTMQSF